LSQIIGSTIVVVVAENRSEGGTTAHSIPLTPNAVPIEVARTPLSGIFRTAAVIWLLELMLAMSPLLR
jgi:hypothetical protein